MMARIFANFPIILFLLFLHSCAKMASACPQSVLNACKCVKSPDDSLRIDCSGRTLDETAKAMQNAGNANVDILALHDANFDSVPANVFGSITARTIDLSGNKIARIDNNAFAAQAAQLTTLLLANNLLTAVPKLDALTNLETLDLSGNNLTAIPDNAFNSTKKIRQLRFRGNNICELTPNAFNETKNVLEVLDLSKNCFKEVPAQNLRGAQKLTYVDLSANKLSYIRNMQFMNLPALTELRLDENSLSEITPLAFMNVPNLERLNLRGNSLSNLDANRFASFANLETIDLSANKLSKLPSNSFKDMSNLKQIFLDGNVIESIETLAFSSLPLLQMISMQNAGLKRIFRNAFDSLPTLSNLLLSNNSLNDIGPGVLAGMPSLKQLILSGNQLPSLTSGTFDAVSQLTTLDLSDNVLQLIAADVFQKLAGLFWLDLSGNRLQTIPQNTFSSKISNLLLAGNPLVCDDSLTWLIRYMVSNNVRTFLPGEQDVTCASPPNKKGTLLKDLMITQANDTFFQSLTPTVAPVTSSFGSEIANGLISTFVTPKLSLFGGIGDLSTPLTNLINNNPLTKSDMEALLKALPSMALLLGAPGGDINNLDLTKMPPDMINFVARGGSLPGVSDDTMKKLTQLYIQQMAAKAAQASGNQLQQVNTVTNVPGTTATASTPSISDMSPDQINALVTGAAPLPPLSSLSPDMVNTVMSGGLIPGLTKDQTEAIKNRYMQQMLSGTSTLSTSSSISTVASAGSISTTSSITTTGSITPVTATAQPTKVVLQQPQPSQPVVAPATTGNAAFNLSDLQGLNIDFSRIPAEVVQDLFAGRTPDFTKIPQDIIQTIMEKRPMLFGEIVSQQLRPKITAAASDPNGGTVTPGSSTTWGTTPNVAFHGRSQPYDINQLDTMADISVYNQKSNQNTAIMWTCIVLAVVFVATVIIIVVLCCRHRRQMASTANRQIEDTADTSKFFAGKHMVAINMNGDGLAPPAPGTAVLIHPTQSANSMLFSSTMDDLKPGHTMVAMARENQINSMLNRQMSKQSSGASMNHFRQHPKTSSPPSNVMQPYPFSPQPMQRHNSSSSSVYTPAMHGAAFDPITQSWVMMSKESSPADYR